MASKAQGEPAFRRWLVTKLAVMRTTWPSGSDEEVARWLGVTVEVLREARELQQGGRTVSGYERVGVQYQLVRMMMPRPIFAALQELEKIRDVPRQTLLRSVVHHLLIQYELPDHDNYRSGHGWDFGGKIYKLSRRSAESGKKRDRWDVCCMITFGAHEALQLRASLNGTVPTALMRGALLDLLSGRIQNLSVVPSTTYMPENSGAYSSLWKETE